MRIRCRSLGGAPIPYESSRKLVPFLKHFTFASRTDTEDMNFCFIVYIYIFSFYFSPHSRVEMRHVLP